MYRRLLARDAADRDVPQLRQGTLHRSHPADEKYRAAQTHHSARSANQFSAARAISSITARTI